jgi:acetolactate synthase-1/2/3 large subunit
VSCNPATFGKNAKILHIDIDAAEINKNVKVQEDIVGDLKYILSALNQKLPALKHTEWLSQISSWKKEFPQHNAVANCDSSTVLPQTIIVALDKLTNGSAIITTEVGQHQMWTAQFYNFRQKRSFVSSGGLGTMGFGLGAAIGSKVANPERTVINIAGDGSFYMNLTELSTLAKYNIPVIQVVMNNKVLGMVRQWQKLFYERRFSQTTLEKSTDFMKLAEAFGIDGYRISKDSEVQTVLQKALSSNRPALIECSICEDVNVLPMVPAGGCISEPIMAIDN